MPPSAALLFPTGARRHEAFEITFLSSLLQSSILKNELQSRNFSQNRSLIFVHLLYMHTSATAFAFASFTCRQICCFLLFQRKMQKTYLHFSSAYVNILSICKSDDRVALYRNHFFSECGLVGAAWVWYLGCPPGAAV